MAATMGMALCAAGPPASNAASKPASTTITVQPGTTGSPLPAGFTGLSFEASTLAKNQFSPGQLVPYLKTIGGSGVLRIGGNSSDKTFWTSTGEKPPPWSEGTITPASLQGLAAVAKASGWKVILGVNLKHKDPARAADEAKHAQQVLGSELLAIEIGNEPNYYYTSESTYFGDFESYVAAITKGAPGVRLTGPDPGHNHPAFLAAFATSESGHPDIVDVTDHHYPLSACNGNKTTIPELLSTDSVQNETAAAESVVNAGKQLNIPPAMTETNSVTCGGTAGVSDVFASSLWALDYGLLLARDGVVNAEYHGQLSGCGAYSPLCSAGTGLAAQPVFYGMLALTLVGNGSFVSVTNPDSANVRAYAVANGSHLTVALDDVQNPASNGSTVVSLNLGATFHQGRQTLLSTSSSSGLSATTGITLGGHTVASDGSFPQPTTTPVSVSGQSATIRVKAGSAAIIQFN